MKDDACTDCASRRRASDQVLVSTNRLTCDCARPCDQSLRPIQAAQATRRSRRAMNSLSARVTAAFLDGSPLTATTRSMSFRSRARLVAMGITSTHHATHCSQGVRLATGRKSQAAPRSCTPQNRPPPPCGRPSVIAGIPVVPPLRLTRQKARTPRCYSNPSKAEPSNPKGLPWSS